ncbi:hypothetical protein SRB5_50480 [Streptomyces sp. RB5]|uniref:Uncharacterized protein n=1 Tax=Streptomyces smaragdinus TaxID=2585196 RepID=A0A7K0CPC3_9ACTN|nr:hypothetical protein [Streptomyces smaragdinus]
MGDEDVRLGRRCRRQALGVLVAGLVLVAAGWWLVRPGHGAWPAALRGVLLMGGFWGVTGAVVLTVRYRRVRAALRAGPWQVCGAATVQGGNGAVVVQERGGRVHAVMPRVVVLGPVRVAPYTRAVVRWRPHPGGTGGVIAAPGGGVAWAGPVGSERDTVRANHFARWWAGLRAPEPVVAPEGDLAVLTYARTGAVAAAEARFAVAVRRDPGKAGLWWTRVWRVPLPSLACTVALAVGVWWATVYWPRTELAGPTILFTVPVGFLLLEPVAVSRRSFALTRAARSPTVAERRYVIVPGREPVMLLYPADAGSGELPVETLVLRTRPLPWRWAHPGPVPAPTGVVRLHARAPGDAVVVPRVDGTPYVPDGPLRGVGDLRAEEVADLCVLVRWLEAVEGTSLLG